MREQIIHPTYGTIVYNESFWRGGITITVNGTVAQRLSKKSFTCDGKMIIVMGSILTGVTLLINNERVEITPKSKWYEILFAVLPAAFMIIWGNNPALCSIFPIIGGAVGGGLGGALGATSLVWMKRYRSPLVKILIGLGVFVGSVIVSSALALVLLTSVY